MVLAASASRVAGPITWSASANARLTLYSSAHEYRAGDRYGIAASAGWTDHIVTPERGVRAVDGLLTGLHEPRSSHLRMLAAFAGQDLLARCYAAAIEHGYLWHEFGDLHLLLP